MNINANMNAIQTHSTKLNENADNLSQAAFQEPSALPNPSQDIARNLTDNIQIENGFDAQIRSINIANQMVGNVLDIKS